MKKYLISFLVFGLFVLAGSANAQVPPSVSITASPTVVKYGSTTTITYKVANADSCQASGGSAGWAGSKPKDGGSFRSGPLSTTTTYQIKCSNIYGTRYDFVNVLVKPNRGIIIVPKKGIFDSN